MHATLLRSQGRRGGMGFVVFQLGWLLLALAALLLARPARASEDPPGRVGRMVEVQGTVWLYDLSHSEWTAAVRNRPLTSGDRLSTDAGSLAELRIGSTTLRLDGQTDVELRRIDDERLSFVLHRGALALRVRSPEVAAETEVLTPEGRFVPLRPGHYRIDRPDDATRAAAWRGALRFDGADSALDIAAGRQAELWQQGPQRATHYTWRAMPSDAFADWVARDDAAEEASVSARYVSTEMTGYEELDRHGSWSTHAEYGPLWIPARVEPGWAPYRHGYWKWVAPWGWTWIDQAPWGFAPFHYGRWVYVGTRWCWAPGHRVARPVYAPALVAWVGHSSPGVSVSIGVGAPAVGWVPLAPWEAYRPWYRHGPRYGVVVNQPHDPPRHRTPDTRERIPGRPDGGHPHGGWANQHAPGAVTMVSTDSFRGRQVPVQPVDAPRGAAAPGLVPLGHAPAAPTPRSAAVVQDSARPLPPPPRDRERVPMPQGRPPAETPRAATPVAPGAPAAVLPAPHIPAPARVVATPPGPAAIVAPQPAAPQAPAPAAPAPVVRPPAPPAVQGPPSAPPRERGAPPKERRDAKDDKRVEGKRDEGKREEGKPRGEPDKRERSEPPKERGGPRTAQQ